jgi:transcription elongation factor Elf1
MNYLTDKPINCPYCGETIRVLIEPSDMDQQYIEDCQVCCRPINFSVYENMNGDIDVNVFSEDDAF